MQNRILRRYKLALPLMFALLCVCAESEEVITKKLDIVLADDLEAILEGIDPEALLDKPYIDLVEYRTYKEGAYSRMAIVDFFFFKTLGIKITRKYRYHKRQGLWDRYHNKYYSIAPDSGETEAGYEQNSDIR